jgi:hypothetical protein
MSPHLGEQLQERIIIWRFQERKTVVESRDIEISIAILTHKHASKAASERDELLRATWLAE